MIIGVTGLSGSGKGAVSEILTSKGFIKLGLSSGIDEELRKRGIEINRMNQIRIANEMRKAKGRDYWAKILLERIGKEEDLNQNYVVEGFRNTAEVDAFRKVPGFILIGVAAGFLRRSEWIIKRARIGDCKTIEEFREFEKIDFLEGIAEGQQNALCFAMADRYIQNEGTFEELREQVERFLKEI